MANKILYLDLFEYSTSELAQQNWVTDASGLALDLYEYATDEICRAAYVSSDATPVIDQQQTIVNIYSALGNDGGNDFGRAQSFKLSADLSIGKVSLLFGATTGSPSGQVTCRIETDSAGLPSGTLAHINATKVFTPSASAWNDIVFDSSFSLSGVTTYWIVLIKDAQIEGNYWTMGRTSASEYADGVAAYNIAGGAWISQSTIDLCFKVYTIGNLQCYSESTIKNQGSYSLKVLAAQTNSLNDTLTKSGLLLDLSGKDALKLDVRAGRTGRNLEVQLRDTGYSSILNEDCSDISDWIDADAVNGESTQVTFDAKSCFKFDTNVAAENNEAERTRNISIADNFNVELNVYLDAVSADTSNAFRIVVSNTNTQLLVSFQSNGLFIHDGSSYNKVGTDLTQQDVWQKWRFEVRGANYLTAKCDVYLNDELKASNIDCSYQTPTSNRILLQLKGYNDNDRIAYLDYINIDTGVHRKSINITSVDTFQEITWDISNIVDTDKDVIDKIIFKILNADAANTFYIDNFRAPESLQCYSEDTIKVQGDYSLKVLAAQTGSLNKTLTKTLTDYLDYSIQDVIKFDIRASRTGSNIKLKIHDVGGDTQEHTINIASANEWQTETWDITGITGTKRDQIDKIIIEISNADFANTIYIDNLYSKVIVETAYTWMGG